MGERAERIATFILFSFSFFGFFNCYDMKDNYNYCDKIIRFLLVFCVIYEIDFLL